MAPKKPQNDFRHKTSEAYLRRGGEKKNLRNIWFQDTGKNTYFRTAWSKDRKRVERNVRGALCSRSSPQLALGAQHWILPWLHKVPFLHQASFSIKERRLHNSVISQSIFGKNCFPWSFHQSSLLSFNREVYNLEEPEFSRALPKKSWPEWSLTSSKIMFWGYGFQTDWFLAIRDGVFSSYFF